MGNTKKAKVGDTIRVINNTFESNYAKAGEEYEVTRVYPDGLICVGPDGWTGGVHSDDYIVVSNPYKGPTATFSEDVTHTIIREVVTLEEVTEVVSEGLVTLTLSKQDAANLRMILRRISGYDGPNGLRESLDSILRALPCNIGVNAQGKVVWSMSLSSMGYKCDS